MLRVPQHERPLHIDCRWSLRGGDGPLHNGRAPDTTSEQPQSQPAHEALDDAELEQAWRDLGEPDEYEPPSEREPQYLADSRRRSQGMRMQSQRLHRNK